MYLPTGDIPSGSISASDFNSTKFPGICKPTNFDALDKFKEMQRQLNRIAQVKRMTMIAVDGDIGPSTLRLVQSTGPYMMVPHVGVDPASCSFVAMNALVIAAQAKSAADAAGVPAKISQPRPSSPPSIVTPSGAIVPQKTSIFDAFENMSTPMMLVLGAAVVGGAYYFTRKNGK